MHIKWEIAAFYQIPLCFLPRSTCKRQNARQWLNVSIYMYVISALISLNWGKQQAWFSFSTLCVMFQELALLWIMAKASWGLDLCPAGSLEFIWTRTALEKKGLEEHFTALLGSTVFMTSDLFQINASFQQSKSIFRLLEKWLTSVSVPQLGWNESKTKSKIIRHKKGSGSQISVVSSQKGKTTILDFKLINQQ